MKMGRDRSSDRCSRSKYRSERKRARPPSRERESSRRRKERRVSRERSRSPYLNERRSTPGTDNSCNSDFAKLTEVLSNIVQMTSKKQGNNYLNEKFLPEFDPSNKSLSASDWLDKINTCGILYDWSEKTKLYLAVCRLRGNAQLWYNELHNSQLSWPSFSYAIMKQFPGEINFGKLLVDAANYKSELGQDLQAYCFIKLGKLNKMKLEIPEDKLVDFVAYGIRDEQVRTTVLAARLKTLDELNSCLSTFDESGKKGGEDGRNRNKDVMGNKIRAGARNMKGSVTIVVKWATK